MIGSYVRGPRHLIRSVEENKSLNLLLIKNGRVNSCEALISQLKDGRNVYVFFQNIVGNRNYERLIDNKFHNLFHEKLSNYNYFIFVTDKKERSELLDLSSIYYDCIILPTGFNEMYEDFLKSNKKLFNSISNYLYYNDFGKYLFSLIDNKPNLFQWAMSNLFKGNVSLTMLKHIIMWNDNYSKQVNKLSKGTITAYNGRDNIVKLYEELTDIRSKKRANDSINLFNTMQKKALKSFDLNDKQIGILNRFGRLSLKKKINFVRKMSTIDSPIEILKQMLYLTNSQFDWDKNSVVDYINNAENIKSKIIINDSDILLVKVNDYDTVKFLARTTNWCISKNKRYWDDYVGNKGKKINQYILYDFSKKEDDNLSIIGFTIDKTRGITHAHDFTNESLMYEEDVISNVNSFFPTIKKNIFSILKAHNVNINSLIDRSDKRYEWDCESFINFLNHCIDENNMEILLNTKERAIIKTKDCNISHAMPLAYERVFGGDVRGHNIFIFADFTMNENDPKRLLWCIISSSNMSHQESCTQLFDANGKQVYGISFDRLLDENHIPYDIICRVYNEESSLVDSFISYDIKRIDSILTSLRNKNVTKLRSRNSKYSNTIPNIVENSVRIYKTFDFIDVIYNNGYKLCDLSKHNDIYYLIRNLLDYSTGDIECISDEDIESFNNGKLKDNRKISIIGYMMSFKKIFSHETDMDLFKLIIENSYEFSYNKLINEFIFDKLTSIFIKMINENIEIKFNNFINQLFILGYDNKIDLILKNCNNNNIIEYINNFIERRKIKERKENCEEFVLV